VTSKVLVQPSLFSKVRSAVLWPREHGAWGLVTAPLVLGTGVAMRAGGNRWLAWGAMVVTVGALFLARTPLESLLGLGTVRASGEAEVAAAKRRALLWGVLALAGAVVTSIFLRPETFALFAMIGLVAYATQWLLPKAQAQLAVGIAFAAGAPATYVALTGRTGGVALVLALAAGVLGANQVGYVQLEINALKNGLRASRLRFGWPFLVFQTLTIAALAWALRAHAITWLVALGSAPLLARGYWHFVRAPKRVALKRLGFTELAYTAAAVALLIAGVGL
jgi:YwiC-like protein